ncbi:type II toxin-antitoxin system RelE/ParE family toxin [Ciceribacter sp. RN22]|uniref:type II toxin-antitoxin system RelE/ParE family toxin n=1 Tax=Ciceribacter sp. RN22 TaxID=2954932 RepID=UPI0020A6EE91|nr:type II toxin-antitoxin system RelE/ParE family toxin [Ciceribacter sp. RN22]
MKVLLAPEARNYVSSEARYLKARSPQAARRFADSLKQLKEHLSQFPHLGKVSDETPVPGVLRFVMGAYLVDYEIRPGVIVILGIRHGQQRPPGMPLDEDFDFEAP